MFHYMQHVQIPSCTNTHVLQYITTMYNHHILPPSP